MRVNELKLVGAQPSTAASPARILEEAEIATDSKGGERDVGAPKFLALYIHTDALLSTAKLLSAGAASLLSRANYLKAADSARCLGSGVPANRDAAPMVTGDQHNQSSRDPSQMRFPRPPIR
jgi:hypothetical protein